MRFQFNNLLQHM